MQATDKFKEIVSQYLQSLAANDELFAETLKKPAKNIDDCITYILNTVKASGKMGFADEEVFGMAVHYYDEDDIKVGKAINAKVIVNQPAKGSGPKTATAEKKPLAKQKGRGKSPIDQPSLFS